MYKLYSISSENGAYRVCTHNSFPVILKIIRITLSLYKMKIPRSKLRGMDPAFQSNTRFPLLNLVHFPGDGHAAAHAEGAGAYLEHGRGLAAFEFGAGYGFDDLAGQFGVPALSGDLVF